MSGVRVIEKDARADRSESEDGMPLDTVFGKLAEYASDGLWGKVTLHFFNGKISLLEKTESLKPRDLKR